MRITKDASMGIIYGQEAENEIREEEYSIDWREEKSSG